MRAVVDRRVCESHILSVKPNEVQGDWSSARPILRSAGGNHSSPRESSCIIAIARWQCADSALAVHYGTRCESH